MVVIVHGFTVLVRGKIRGGGLALRRSYGLEMRRGRVEGKVIVRKRSKEEVGRP